jgi:uncharacterized protein (DUF39 family)
MVPVTVNDIVTEQQVQEFDVPVTTMQASQVSEIVPVTSTVQVAEQKTEMVPTTQYKQITENVTQQYACRCPTRCP